MSDPLPKPQTAKIAAAPQFVAISVGQFGVFALDREGRVWERRLGASANGWVWVVDQAPVLTPIPS